VDGKALSGMIGESAPMLRLFEKIRALSRSRAAVFITGESGTGKELCAEAIHKSSARAKGPFVPINCAAIPRELMESEIFGHLRGAFTGAVADRRGASQQAQGGTLFLDEICELDTALQTKLLRFLQSGLVRRVGSAAAEAVDVRILCATNRSPLEEVRKGTFREDLFYRLHVLPLHVPPLRDRERDVLAIARHFLRQFSREEGKAFSEFSAGAEAALVGYAWPGNVRELQNVIRQAVVLNEGRCVTREMLWPALAAGPGLPSAHHLATAHPAFVGKELWRIEKDAIENTIEACGGSVPQAARMLGVSPSTLYRKRGAWAAAAP